MHSLDLEGSLNLSEVSEVSLRDLLVHFPKYFYYCVADADSSMNVPVWNAIHPVRRDVLEAYSKLSEAGGIVIERSLFSLPEVDHLPNIAELMMWWMGFMHMHGGSHGYRSFRTPSSTKLPDGRVLCVGFLVNEYLWLRPSFDTDRQVVYPDNYKAT